MNQNPQQDIYITRYDLEGFILDNNRKYDKRDIEESFAGSGENSFMTYGDFYDTFFDQEGGDTRITQTSLGYNL